VVELETGRTLAFLPVRERDELRCDSTGALFGEAGCATTWYDAAGVERARRTECADEGWVTVTPAGWCAGNPAGLRRHWARIGDDVRGLAALAPEVLAPRKVAAAIAGVVVTPPRVPAPSRTPPGARR
jgi:hypothetical protein